MKSIYEFLPVKVSNYKRVKVNLIVKIVRTELKRARNKGNPKVIKVILNIYIGGVSSTKVGKKYKMIQ